MKELVLVKGKEVFCDSQMVADKFGRRHKEVVEKIKKLLQEHSEIKRGHMPPLKFIKTEGNYRNQKYEMYLMDKKAFTLLSMRFSGKKALIWQEKFVDAFFELESQLLKLSYNKNDPAFQQFRPQSIEERKKETDIIKEFVEYATNQGSENAKFYYKHLTKSVYKCLALVQHKQPKLRETLNFTELNQVVIAEKLIKDSLEYYMSTGEHYKVIFSLIKQELEKFSDSLNLNRTKRLNE